MTSDDLLQAAFARTNDAIAISEYDSTTPSLCLINPAFENLSGYPSIDCHRQDFRNLLHLEAEQDTLEAISQHIAQACDGQFKLKCCSRDGASYWAELNLNFLYKDSQAEPSHIVAVLKDISQEEYAKNVLDKVNFLYKEMSKRLEYSNETDLLTKLKNRNHLSTRGEFMLSAAKRQKLRLHALALTLDNYSLLQTSGGRGLADEAVIRIGQALQHAFGRATDIPARYCENQFIVLSLEDDDIQLRNRAENLIGEIEGHCIKDFEGSEHKIAVSIGLHSETPDKTCTLEAMILQAEAERSQQRVLNSDKLRLVNSKN